MLTVKDSSGHASDSLTLTAVLLLAFVALAFLVAFGAVGDDGPAMVAALGAAFGASLPLYYKRRAQRDGSSPEAVESLRARLRAAEAELAQVRALTTAPQPNARAAAEPRHVVDYRRMLNEAPEP